METRKCVQCGRDFALTDGEIKFYQEKGLTLPKRCPECRNKNKKEKNAPKVVKQTAPAKSIKIPSWTVVVALAVIFALALVVIIPKLSDIGTVEFTEDVPTQSQNVIPDPGEESSHTVNSTPSYYGKDNSGDENFTISGGYSGGEESPVYNGGSSNSGSSSYSGSSGSYSQSSSDAMAPPAQSSERQTYSGYTFRSSSLLASHFAKHGREVGAASETEYVNMANNVINSATQHKNEKEDNDDIYFKSSTGEIVFVSTDGYIRTYFIADQAYFDRQ